MLTRLRYGLAVSVPLFFFVTKSRSRNALSADSLRTHCHLQTARVRHCALYCTFQMYAVLRRNTCAAAFSCLSVHINHTQPEPPPPPPLTIPAARLQRRRRVAPLYHNRPLRALQAVQDNRKEFRAGTPTKRRFVVKGQGPVNSGIKPEFGTVTTRLTLMPIVSTR